MKSRVSGIRSFRSLVCGLLMGAVAVPLLVTQEAAAGERKYLVILAHSPKQFGGAAIPPGGLANPQEARKSYFDQIDPNVDSFAEYWEEISYGDVTISGRVTDWIILPWAIQPQQPMTFANLNRAGGFNYGDGEDFDTSKAMVVVDLDGNPNGNDDGPFEPEENPLYAQGAGAITTTGIAVWTPGERFLDMDADNRWDGFDEAANVMDWDEDDRPDHRGPWYDLNQDGLAANPQNCTYLPDSDNDGNPDCCPEGPGSTSCRGYPQDGLISCTAGSTGPCPCPPLSWTGPNDSEIEDRNGNLIPDACDVSCTSQECRDSGWGGACGTKRDNLPFVSVDTTCVAGAGNGVPDETEFSNVLPLTTGCRDPGLNCTGTPDTRDPCCTLAECVPVPTGNAEGSRDTTPRCEYDDANGNNQLDVVEPFENGLVRAKRVVDVRASDPDFCQNRFTDQQITDNFPGAAPAALVARGKVREIYGSHDPFSKLARCFCDPPTNLVPCGTGRTCKAGEHAEFNPPDSWTDAQSATQVSAKMRIDTRLLETKSTPEPPWYKQAWKDRYGVTADDDVPPWNHDLLGDQTLAAVRMSDRGPEARREFLADRGGLFGNGFGWLNCGEVGNPVEFKTGLCGDFEDRCNRRILPEETNGIGGRLVVYDGFVEHDDLPSSKYHRAGDRSLGEVTSPFRTEIWGFDRGAHCVDCLPGPDEEIPAAGPYAINVHGQGGYDAGNVLQMELLTWRTKAPFNNGKAWLATYEIIHPYLIPGPLGPNLGFRDYNLDGLVDLGEVMDVGRENYVADAADPISSVPRGTNSMYPWNRRRLLEDCIAVLDAVIDFDDFVDPVAMNAVTCGGGSIEAPLPAPFHNSGDFPNPDGNKVAGICSGIVLLPAGSHIRLDFLGATSFFHPDIYPIHTEDGLPEAGQCDDDLRRCFGGLPPTPNICTTNADCPPNPGFPNGQFPKGPYSEEHSAQLSWHLLFHDLVIDLGASGEGSGETGAFQAPYSAHEWLHTWEGFPDLYDYDVYDLPNAIENCPIGRWDIMADGGMVHPTPILKEAPCTRWIESVDLTTILTPGVDRAVTLPPAEFVRDNSYVFLENEDRLGERFYFWSAGSGFDRFMPGEGVLIMHTDVGSNPDALPQQQRSGDRPQYMIVQADGRNDILTCVNRGDSGDPWPGSTGNTQFDCGTVPASEWYTDNACTGLEVLDIVPDENGSALVTFNWTPTNIPSLKFIDPPGGVSVGPIYTVQTEATDLFGGTWIRFYYTTDETGTPNPATATLIALRQKTTPATTNISVPWNITGRPDNRYFLFADLIPSLGADGVEKKLTNVRAGRNNVGTASLSENQVIVDTSTINPQTGLVTHTGKSRLETWSIRNVDGSAGKWFVSSSLTQPLPSGEPTLALCNANPAQCATTGVAYTSVGGAVRFTIRQGTGASPKGAVGDSFTFTTTGITALSAGVIIRDGKISENPTAVIVASPLSGRPPLEVQFDARNSVDPNGQPLIFEWRFGDGETETGPQPSHTYTIGGTYTVTLKAINPANTLFDEASVDIEVTDDPPTARIKATTPTGGGAPLLVRFSGTDSSDTETPDDRLIYQWGFGDGTSANDDGLPGILSTTEHTYSQVRSNADTVNCTTACPCTPTGRTCTIACPCTFTTTLTVTDESGKSDSDSLSIRVGNSNPVVNITTTATTGVSPLTVTFNAKGSTDAENDKLEVVWTWGDGSASETYPAKTGKPPATDGSVPHTFTLPANVPSRSFQVTALVRDVNPDGSLRGGATLWTGVTVTVSTEAAPPSPLNQPPIAILDGPAEVFVGQVANFSASRSTDPDGDDLRYRWVFGDGGALGSFGTNPNATHRYTAAGVYEVRLTVRDEANASTDATRSVSVVQDTPNETPVALIATGTRTGSAPLTLTFDGSISYDPDGDVITHLWEFRREGELIGTMSGAVVTRVFAVQGQYSVLLKVRDSDGAEGQSEVEEIIVTELVVPPPPEPPPPAEVPEEPPDSAGQRPPTSMCGLGMLMSMLGSLLGLSMTALTRRRSRA